MPKITDEQYRYLSRAVYFVGKFPHQYRKGRMVTMHRWRTEGRLNPTSSWTRTGEAALGGLVFWKVWEAAAMSRI